MHVRYVCWPNITLLQRNRHYRQSEVYNNVTAQTLIRPIPFSLTVYSIENNWDAFSNI